MSEKNDKLQELIHYFGYRYSRDISDRKSDLQRLASIESSFILLSMGRNGTSTLFKNLSTVKNGNVIHYSSSFENINSKIESQDKPLILIDEALYSYNHYDSKEVNEFYVDLSRQKQVGLRIHPKTDTKNLKYLRDNGFTIVEIGQTPFTEFETSVLSKCREFDIDVPEKMIEEAYSRFNVLAPLYYFVSEYFKTMMEKPDNVSSDDVMKQVLQLPLFDRHPEYIKKTNA